MPKPRKAKGEIAMTVVVIRPGGCRKRILAKTCQALARRARSFSNSLGTAKAA